MIVSKHDSYENDKHGSVGRTLLWSCTECRPYSQLLLLNQQVYIESRPFLYGFNTFSFCDLTSCCHESETVKDTAQLRCQGFSREHPLHIPEAMDCTYFLGCLIPHIERYICRLELTPHFPSSHYYRSYSVLTRDSLEWERN